MKKVAGIAIGTALLFIEKRDRERVRRVLVPACYQGHATILVEREEKRREEEEEGGQKPNTYSRSVPLVAWSRLPLKHLSCTELRHLSQVSLSVSKRAVIAIWASTCCSKPKCFSRKKNKIKKKRRRRRRRRKKKKSESNETRRKEGHLCGGEYLHTTKFCLEVSSAWPSDLRPARAGVHVHIHIHCFIPSTI